MKKIVIIASAAVVLLGGGGAGVYFFLPDLLPEFIRPHTAPGGGAAKAKAGKEAKREPEVPADLDVFVVNLAGPPPPRYLRTTLSLGVKSEHDKEKIKELSAKIRHAVIMYLTERTAEELIDPAGKNKLRQALRNQIVEAIGDQNLVSNVYFKEFLIQ